MASAVSNGRPNTLKGVAELVAAHEAVRSDEIVSLKTLSMDPDQAGVLVVRRGKDSAPVEFPMEDHAVKMVNRVLYDMPPNYLRKMIENNPRLAAENFNFWVENSKDREVLLRRVETDGSQHINAMLPATWRPMPYSRVIQMLVDKHGQDAKIDLHRFDEKCIDLRFLTGEVDCKQTKKVGDTVKWGQRYADSDIGWSPFTMAGYSMRLACTNGMVTLVKGMGMELTHSKKDFDDQDIFLATLAQCMNGIDAFSAKVGQQMDAASRIPINDLEQTMTKLRGRFNTITKLEDKYVKEAWEEEGALEPTVYRLANSFTRAGTHGEELAEKHESRLRLQVVGGSVLDLALSKFNFN